MNTKPPMDERRKQLEAEHNVKMERLKVEERFIACLPACLEQLEFKWVIGSHKRAEQVGYESILSACFTAEKFADLLAVMPVPELVPAFKEAGTNYIRFIGDKGAHELCATREILCKGYQPAARDELLTLPYIIDVCSFENQNTVSFAVNIPEFGVSEIRVTLKEPVAVIKTTCDYYNEDLHIANPQTYRHGLLILSEDTAIPRRYSKHTMWLSANCNYTLYD